MRHNKRNYHFCSVDNQMSESDDDSNIDNDDSASCSKNSARAEFKHPGEVLSSPRSHDQGATSSGHGSMACSRLQANSYDTEFGQPSHHQRM